MVCLLFSKGTKIVIRYHCIKKHWMKDFISNCIMSNKHLLKVKRIHPKEFKLKHGLSVSEIHELSDYPPETLKHWLADEHSSRYQQPKESVLNHFGLLDLYLSP